VTVAVVTVVRFTSLPVCAADAIPVVVGGGEEPDDRLLEPSRVEVAEDDDIPDSFIFQFSEFTKLIENNLKIRNLIHYIYGTRYTLCSLSS
jgi:hypothetical protein